MKRKLFAIVSAGLLAVLTSGSLNIGMARPWTTGQDKHSLYHRLGGYDAIAAVTDEFITRLATDKDLGRFFVGLSTDSGPVCTWAGR